MSEAKTFSEMEPLEKVIYCMLFVPVFLIIMILLILYLTWAASTLYGWFLVPLGLPAIKFWHMYGIMLFVGVVFRGNPFIPKKRAEGLQLWTIAGSPLVTVIIGWIIKSFLI